METSQRKCLKKMFKSIFHYCFITTTTTPNSFHANIQKFHKGFFQTRKCRSIQSKSEVLCILRSF